MLTEGDNCRYRNFRLDSSGGARVTLRQSQPCPSPRGFRRSSLSIIQQSPVRLEITKNSPLGEQRRAAESWPKSDQRFSNEGELYTYEETTLWTRSTAADYSSWLDTGGPRGWNVGERMGQCPTVSIGLGELAQCFRLGKHGQRATHRRNDFRCAFAAQAAAQRANSISTRAEIRSGWSA